MKRFAGHLAVAATFALGALLGAEEANAQTATGITATKHNLTSTGPGPNRVTAGTDEICVFCHTPHAASTGDAPLWNKALPTNTYQMYSSTTMDGTALAVGSVSLACLSCHDGTQAMDNVVNAPGSCGYDVTGGGADGRSWTWATGGTVDSTGKLQNTTIAMLGTDLRNDHPIGIPYCGGGITSATASGTNSPCADQDFRGPIKANLNGQDVWWVDTAVGTAGTRQRTDMILYTRNSTPYVECGSCHDPHVNQGEGNAGATFLRVANTGSAVCLACHVK